MTGSSALSILAVTIGVLVVAGRQEPQPVKLILSGDEVLAMEVALKAFHSDKLLKTAYQRDLSHYTIDIIDKDGAYRIHFYSGFKIDKTSNNPLSGDGIDETMIIDKKTKKLIRTEILG